jgi:hypothetical protein
MMKDPLDLEENPYDVLNLPPEATPAEVHQALPRFMRDRRNVPRLGKAQEAIRKLKAPAERAGVDIWLYQIDMPAAEGGQVDEDFPLGDYLKPILIPLEQSYVGLNDETGEAQAPRVEFPPLAVPYLDRYCWGEQRDWPVRFDR